MRDCLSCNQSVHGILFALICLILPFVSINAPAQTTPTRDSQFLYVLNGGAILRKFDAQTGMLLATVDLCQQHPKWREERECGISGVLYLPQEESFVTLHEYVEGYQGSLRNATYSLLRFHLPDFKETGAFPLPGRYQFTDYPRLHLSSSGTVQILTSELPYELRGGKFVPVVDIDKSCFKQYCIAKSQPSGNSNYPYAVSVLEYMISGLKPAPGQSVIEFSPNSESGNVVLAKVENPATTFIAIDTAAKRVVAMVPPFSTDYDNVNLVPGGKTALYWKDNQLALLDTSNGFVLRTWNEDLTGLRGICGGGVTAITSSGLAVTDSCKADRDVFHATSLGLSSSLQPTQDEVQNRVSWYFFAVQ